MRPGGPTITKMKEQLGGLWSGYTAPTPEQVDLHHRLRTEGKDGLLNVELPALSLKGNPSLPPIDKTTHGSNESWVNWMTRHQKGLGGAPDMLATYIKNFGADGVVQARDFVEQWDKAVPGEGATAIRAILSLLSEPAQQRAFLGGDLPKGIPFGVLKSDPADAMQAQEWVYDLVSKTAYLRGTQPGEQAEIHPAVWRQGDEAKPVPLPYNPKDEEPRWEYDPITGNARWVAPETKLLRSSDATTDQAQESATGRDADEIDHDRLAPYLDRQEHKVGPGVQVAQNGGTVSDAMSERGSNQQLAQASSKRENRMREPFKGDDTTPEYRDLILAKEANGIANPLEAFKRDSDGIEVLGQYQMNRHALVDAGFKNADGTWKQGNALDIKSDEEFLRGPNAKAAQDAAFEAVSRRNEQHIKNTGIDKKIGSTIDGIKAKIEVTETGLAAAVHRGGIGSVQKYFSELEKHGWDSKKAVDALPDGDKRMYRAVETRLREFSNVGYRIQKPNS
jgi:hypothetical protein